LAVSGAPAETPPLPSVLELPLARSGALYLRLDGTAKALEVKARGLCLQADGIKDVRITIPARQPRPVLPMVLTVEAPPEVQWRRIVVPPALVPYTKDAVPPAAEAEPVAALPDQVEVRLEQGWRLHLGPRPPDRLLVRLGARLLSGWRRLLGRTVEPAGPSLVVVASSELTRSLVHLLARGMPVLVLCGDATPAVSLSRIDQCSP
jgi:hypothetical protein